MVKKEKNLHLTIYDGDKPNDSVYDLKVKTGKNKMFWKMIFDLCEADTIL